MSFSKIARIQKSQLLYQHRDRCDVYLGLGQPVYATYAATRQGRSDSQSTQVNFRPCITFASVSFEVPGTYSPERDCLTSFKKKGEEEAFLMMTF